MLCAGQTRTLLDRPFDKKDRKTSVLLSYQDKDLGVPENTAHLEVLENTAPTAFRRARHLSLLQAVHRRGTVTKRDMRNACL